MYTYPPICTHSHGKHLALFDFKTDWSYISTPMTTGKRYIDHLSLNGVDKLSSPDDILKVNVTRAKEVATKIGKLQGKHNIINPTTYHFENFESNDYLAFWVIVITKCCSNMFFVNDWEYSSGCAYEFLIAQQYSILCMSENLEPISLQNGIDKISEAIKACSPYVDVTFLKNVYDELQVLYCLANGGYW